MIKLVSILMCMLMIVPVTYGATAAIEAWTETIEHDIYAYAEADFVYQTWYVNQGVIDADPMWATNFTSMIYDRSPLTDDYKWNTVKGYGQQSGSYIQVYCHTYTELNGPIPTDQIPRVPWGEGAYPLNAPSNPVDEIRALDEGTTFRWGGGEATYCWTIDIRSYVKFNTTQLGLMMDKKMEGVLESVDLVLTQAPTYSPTGPETDAPYNIYIRPLIGRPYYAGDNISAWTGDRIVDAIYNETTIPLSGVWRWYDVPWATNGDIYDMFLNDTGPYSVGLGFDSTTGAVDVSSMTEEQAYLTDTTQSGMNGFRTRVFYQNHSVALTGLRSSDNWGGLVGSNGQPLGGAVGAMLEFDFNDENQVTDNNRYDTHTIAVSLDTKYVPLTTEGGHSFFYYIANESMWNIDGWVEFSSATSAPSGWYSTWDNEAFYYSQSYADIPNKYSISPTIESILAGEDVSAYGYDTGSSGREAQAYPVDSYVPLAYYGGETFGNYQNSFWKSTTRDTTIQAGALFYGADEFSPTYVDNNNVMHGAGSYGELAGNSGQWNYNNFDPWDIDQPKIDPDTARPYIHGIWTETIEHPGVNMSDFGMYMWIAVAIGIILLSVELNRRRR